MKSTDETGKYWTEQRIKLKNGDELENKGFYELVTSLSARILLLLLFPGDKC